MDNANRGSGLMPALHVGQSKVNSKRDNGAATRAKRNCLSRASVGSCVGIITLALIERNANAVAPFYSGVGSLGDEEKAVPSP